MGKWWEVGVSGEDMDTLRPFPISQVPERPPLGAHHMGQHGRRRGLADVCL